MDTTGIRLSSESRILVVNCLPPFLPATAKIGATAGENHTTTDDTALPQKGFLHSF
jgi:hypothetical protein